MTDEASMERRSGGRERLLVCGLIVAAGWLLSFMLAMGVLSAPLTPKVVWRDGDGTPVPPDFLYLMYPADEEVELYDAPGGERVGTLDRAVLNAHHELVDEWISVIDGDATRWVRRDRLVFFGESAEREGLTTAFVEQWRRSDPEENINVSMAAGTLRVSRDDGWEEYDYEPVVVGGVLYELDEASAKPREMRWMSGIAAGIVGGVATLFAAGVATFLTVMGVVSWRLLKRDMLKPEGAR